MGSTDATKTMGFDEEALWEVPVDERRELADTADEGKLCFVKREGRVYQRRDGAWIDTTTLRARSAAR